LLEQTVNRCTLVNIESPENHFTAISTLLRVNGEEQTFMMDRPYSTDRAESDPGLSKSNLTHITGKSRGASLSFQAEFRGMLEEEGLTLYRFSFPKEIAYAAQRASYRVDTRDSDTLISFTTSSGNVFKAPLCDISDGGLRVMAGRDTIKSIAKGDRIYCTLDIEDESCRKLEVKLCKPSKVDDPNMIEFGATFVDLLPFQKTLISHYIAGMERKLLRKHHAIPEPVPLKELSAKANDDVTERSSTESSTHI